ncbi:TPA: replication initiation factor domain-containing protein, partial [Streptococcus pneumoniae]
YLLAQQRSWYEFFMDVLVAGGVMKRLDLAINDKTGILNIPVLTEKCQQEECISVFRSFKSYRSGELVRKEEKECMGNTLYIGSLQSEVYFCIYEKDYEQYKKNDIPIEDAEVKNRFEIRLKNERAYYAVRDLLVYDNPEHTAFKIINRYIRFVDKDDSKPRSDWKLNEEWAWFIGNNRERLKLTTKPEPYSFQRTLNWLSHQVAPTLKVAIKLDEINQTQVVKDILDHAKLTDRHKQILKQQSVKEQDVITTKKGYLSTIPVDRYPKKDIMGDKTVRVRADLHHIIKIETAKNGGNVKEVMEIRLRSKLKSVLIVHYLKILYNRN